jgi:hypothetical protein
VAKKVAKKRADSRPSLFSPASADIGKTVTVAIKKADDRELDFVLADGTKLHVKVMIPTVLRSLNKYLANGEPVYQIQAGVMLRSDVKKSLTRKLKS